MISSRYCPYAWGQKHVTMAHTARSDAATQSKSLKVCLSSDWGLQFDPMKLELLVIVDQLCHGEYVLGTCTHCPSRQGSQGHPKSDLFRPKVKLMTKMKSNLNLWSDLQE